MKPALGGSTGGNSSSDETECDGAYRSPLLSCEGSFGEGMLEDIDLSQSLTANSSMYHLPLTLETPAENLALDEALLDAAIAGELAGEVLRLWEPVDSFVVLGRSSKPAEVRMDICQAEGVPVLRRPSGGAAVVAGRGCLMYAVVLSLHERHELRHVDRAHQFVLGR